MPLIVALALLPLSAPVRPVCEVIAEWWNIPDGCVIHPFCDAACLDHYGQDEEPW